MPKKKKKKQSMKKKKKGSKKGGKGRTRRNRSNNNPSSPVLSIDDMPGLPQGERTQFKLYRRWEGLPREDSYFQRWLVTTPPDDPSFGRLGGDRAIRLLLSDSAPILTQKKKTAKIVTPPASATLLPSIDSASSLQELFENDYVDDSPLPTSWLQRQTLQPGCGSRRGMYKIPQGTSDEFTCSECEISLATSLCRTCEQMFCLECCKYLHRARLKGLLGHTIIENVKDIVPQAKPSLPFADIKVLARYKF